MTIPHPELPIGAFLAFACLLVCLPSHIRVRNVASVSMNIWFSLVCVISGINSLIWSNDMIVRYPVWCDITTKILIGSNVAFPAAAFSICRFLCDVAQPNAREQTKRVKCTRAWVEVILCWVQPGIIMALHFIVQGHRFDIFEFIGCQPTYYDTWAALFIITIPPLVYCFGTFIYAGFAFYYFLQRRREFELLTKMSPDMNTNRYIRLMIVATAEMIWGTPWYLFLLVSQFSEDSFKPWVSWDFVHSNWYRVGQYPLSLLTPAERNVHLALWWVVPVSGFLFFAFFGFSDQAMKDYRTAITWVRINVFRQEPSRLQDRRDRNGLLPSRQKKENFEDFAKSFNIEIPTKVVDEEALNNPDTWSGWVTKVAREDAARAAHSATSVSTGGVLVKDRSIAPIMAIPSISEDSEVMLSDSPDAVGVSPSSSSLSGRQSQDFIAMRHQSLSAGAINMPSHASVPMRSLDNQSSAHQVCCSCHLPLSPSSLPSGALPRQVVNDCSETESAVL